MGPQLVDAGMANPIGSGYVLNLSYGRSLSLTICIWPHLTDSLSFVTTMTPSARVFSFSLLFFNASFYLRGAQIFICSSILENRMTS